MTGSYPSTTKCPDCDGKGFLYIASRGSCPKCKGTGIVSKEDDI